MEGSEPNTTINSTKIRTGRSWGSKRLEVYERDNGVCDVCTRLLSLDGFECGHIIDRCAGGSDDIDNLVCMCTFCNRVLKPVHDTKEQYDEWKATSPFDLFFAEALRRATI